MSLPRSPQHTLPPKLRRLLPRPFSRGAGWGEGLLGVVYPAVWAVLHPNRGVKAAAIATLWALGLSLSATAGIYTFDYTDTGAVPQAGVTFSTEHAISGLSPSSLTIVQLLLSFNDSASLLGTSAGLQGHLILGSAADSPYVNFYPVDNSGTGLHTYTATFSGISGSPGVGFSGLEANNNWGLVLWDNSASGIENKLTGYSLSLTAVPEPINLALGVFGGLFAGVVAVRRLWARVRASASFESRRSKEVRSPKAEGRKKSEGRNPKAET